MIKDALSALNSELRTARLVAVSKFHSTSKIQEAYEAGQRLFGESRVQEVVTKYGVLPKDIEWHFIGHLQINKVKYIAPFIHTVQSVDSLKLLEELNYQLRKHNRHINVLLQVHIAQEEHKFGFTPEEIIHLFDHAVPFRFPNLCFTGLMGMASFTEDTRQIRREFASLAALFDQIKIQHFAANNSFCDLSMGMSDDYPIALEEGSTMVRIGSKIFGSRN